MPDLRDRRSVLRAGAACCSLSIAGCLGVVDDGDSGNETDGDDGNETNSDDGNETDGDDGNVSDGDENGGSDPDWETIERWPQYQYDAQNTGYAHGDAPTEGVEELWSVEIDAGISASPVVADDTAYVRDDELTMYAVGEDGIQWSTDAGSSPSGATPVIHEEVVITAVKGRIVALYREDGDEAWSYATGGEPRNLTLVDGVVYSPSWASEMHAIDADTGDAIWTESGGFYAQPALHDGDLLVPRATESGEDKSSEIAALDLEEGHARPILHPETSIETGLTIRNGRGFLGAEDGVHAFDLDGRTHEWHYPTNYPVEIELAATKDTVFVHSVDSSYNGSVEAISIKDGEKMWSHASDTSLVNPVVVGDVVLFARDHHTVAAHDANSGEERWTVETTFAPQTVAFCNGRCYVATGEGSLYCFGKN